MSGGSPQLPAWSRPRFVLAVLVLFFAQLGLIFWLGQTKPVQAREPGFAPRLEFAATNNPELLALLDPTLLALPHQEGFAGMAWLTAPRFQKVAELIERNPISFDWSEEPDWLDLQSNELGANFVRIVQTNPVALWESISMPQPEVATPRIQPVFDPNQPSRVYIEGALAEWHPVKPFTLRSWPGRAISPTDSDLLTNTVVQTVIDSAGRPISATLLSQSGSPAADAFALDQVRKARFEPGEGALPEESTATNVINQLHWGRLVFEWNTLPSTNAP